MGALSLAVLVLRVYLVFVHKNTSFTPEAAAGTTKSAAEILDKKLYGQHWQFSVRHVDNLIAQGLPHLKVGKRRVRIIVSEADAWMRERFGTQRRSSSRAKASQGEEVQQ